MEFSLYASLGVLLQGGMVGNVVRSRRGLRQLPASSHSTRSMGAQFYIPYVLRRASLDGYRQQGKSRQSTAGSGEALSLTTTNFDVFWEAELYRLKGTLTLQSKVQVKVPS